MTQPSLRIYVSLPTEDDPTPAFVLQNLAVDKKSNVAPTFVRIERTATGPGAISIVGQCSLVVVVATSAHALNWRAACIWLSFNFALFSRRLKAGVHRTNGARAHHHRHRDVGSRCDVFVLARTATHRSRHTHACAICDDNVRQTHVCLHARALRACVRVRV